MQRKGEGINGKRTEIEARLEGESEWRKEIKKCKDKKGKRSAKEVEVF